LEVLPVAAARPRRLAFQGDDVIWYTDFPRGMLGRLDTKTGEVKEWPSPSGPKSEPYGIVFTKGALWYNESGAKPNTIVRSLDREISELGDPRRRRYRSQYDVTPDGHPVMANSLTNQVGLIEIDSSHHRPMALTQGLLFSLGKCLVQ
jgi:virginiamycin B lyase